MNLVWTDYPGSPAADGGLVNDLDLRVTDPAATVHYPDGVTLDDTIAYESGSFGYYGSESSWAVRFTPESYPAQVTAAVFRFYNPSSSPSAVDIVVYDDDGTGGLPGTELFRTTMASVPSGWNTTAITGVTVASGDFYVAVEEDDVTQGIYLNQNGNPTGRSYSHNDSVWEVDSYTAAIRADVQYDSSFDRTNNVVGLTLATPATGAYTIRVSGYSVPQGPQPFALVVSGGMAGEGAEATLYYPHIACTGVWGTEICAINTSATETVNGVFRGYSDAGVLVSEIDDVALAPHGRREIAVCDDFSDSEEIGYIVFESDSEDVVGYTKFYREGYYRAAIPAVSEINAGDIYVTHIASDEARGWGTGISLLNTTASAKTVTIEFDNGQTRDVDLAAHEHKAVLVRSLFGGQYQPGINSAVIRDADGVIGLEIFTNGVGYQMSGILLKDRTATTMYYPHTRNGGDWGTGIVAYNPSETTCDLTISPYTAAGVALPPPDDDVEITGGAHYIGLVSALVSPETAWLKIESTAEITGLELLAQGTNRLAGCSCVGITGTAGVFSKLERDGTTEIAFANTEGAAATVTLTAYNDAGDVIATEEIDLGAYAKRSGAPVDIFAGDITGATYIGYVSDRALAALQVNAASDNMMLDALPGL